MSSENEFDEEDEDGFINKPRQPRSITTRSPSPPAKRPRYDDSAVGREEKSNGSSNFSDPSIPKELSISILNVEPLDEFIREVADFIWTKIMEANVQGNVQVEVEARLGILRDRRTRERLLLPSMNETSR